MSYVEVHEGSVIGVDDDHLSPSNVARPKNCFDRRTKQVSAPWNIGVGPQINVDGKLADLPRWHGAWPTTSVFRGDLGARNLGRVYREVADHSFAALSTLDEQVHRAHASPNRGCSVLSQPGVVDVVTAVKF